MDIQVKNLKEAQYPCEALMLPCIEGDSEIYNHIDKKISRIFKKSFSKELHGKQNETLLVPAPDNFGPKRLLFIGLGKKESISSEKVRQAGGMAASYLRDLGIKKIALSSNVLSSLKQSPADFIEGTLLGLYTFRKYVSEKNNKSIKTITVLSKGSGNLIKDLHRVKVISSSVNFARDLINTPANDMTPSHLAKIAQSLKKPSLSVKILEKNDVERLGMGAYLSVAYGSHQSPKFIILHYKGNKSNPLVIIGKSITFDSGGLSLKPPDGMEKMKYDMAGGAAVLGILKAACELKIPINLIGILPATENLPGGSAAKPGDIVKALDGKTIEIISTDAEGRMTLADSIGYAKRLKPKAIIDIATLTGACSIALGNGAIAMMGNDQSILDKLKESGNNTYERVWEMPLFLEYKETLKSEIADIKNTGGKSGSLVSSGMFLSEFAGNIPWVHLDIAGTSWVEKEKPYLPKGASGIGVRLLLNFIKKFK